MMIKYPKREVALLAELLAARLIRVYNDDQVPAMVEGFAQAGFTKAALEGDPAKLFQMVAIAAYDRRPFTPAAGGFEEIWGITRGARSIPEALKALDLFAPGDVRHLDRDTIYRRLDSRSYFGLSLASDAKLVRFDRTLSELARLIDGGFHNQMLSANTTQDVQRIYKILTSVHGIGDTIGAKLVKYVHREIGVGRVPADAFPLAVVWPLADEYHLNAAVEAMSARVDRALAPLTMGLLLERGDPFAVDALFYLHRHRNRELDEFVRDAQMMLSGWSHGVKSRPAPVARMSDAQVAQKLLAVIKEIHNASCGISPSEIRRAGLAGVVTPQSIEASARWLYHEMGELASGGQAGEMVSFYQNCLQSERGQIIGWALDKLGRTSMESEEERFRAIYEGRA